MNRNDCGIIPREAAQWLTSPQIERFEHLLERYPDGSLRWAGLDLVEPLFQQLSLRVPGGIAHCVFRPPAALGGGPFVGPRWSLTYPMSYAEQLQRYDESGVILGPGEGRAIHEDEKDLTRCKVRIILYRKVTLAVANELARLVRGWFNDIGSLGVFDAGPISWLSDKLLYEGKEAAFEIDASRSGQDTLNTVYIAIMNWAITRAFPLDTIEIGASQYETVFKGVQSVAM